MNVTCNTQGFNSFAQIFTKNFFLKENAKYDIFDLVEGLQNFRIFSQKLLIEINGSIEI